MDQHSSWKENLRESMEKYARHYYSHLEKKEGIARAFLAEAQILPKSMQTMIAEVIRPVRERLVLILTDAQRAGVVRKEVNVECALDAFKNTLYAGMLRQGVYLPRNYTMDTYISTVVDIFVRGIENNHSLNPGTCYGTASRINAHRSTAARARRAERARPSENHQQLFSQTRRDDARSVSALCARSDRRAQLSCQFRGLSVHR
jgi:hypothetical protein